MLNVVAIDELTPMMENAKLIVCESGQPRISRGNRGNRAGRATRLGVRTSTTDVRRGW